MNNDTHLHAKMKKRNCDEEKICSDFEKEWKKRKSKTVYENNSERKKRQI